MKIPRKKAGEVRSMEDLGVFEHADGLPDGLVKSIIILHLQGIEVGADTPVSLECEAEDGVSNRH